ncbi:MAG: beta-lactamase family protein [Acidobacteria bacterium]|nr:beta-lactamase family protein [Acidobacteriota bacterium]
MTRRDWIGQLMLSLRPDRLDDAARAIGERVASGYLEAAVLAVRGGKSEYVRAFGKARTPRAVFLLASITKPMTAAGVMLLADRRELSLDDPVSRFIPEFRGGVRPRVLIRHLLTHTSGLPDMLPENVELRRRHAPLQEFVDRTCRTPLLFAPGAEVRYQSMGILLAAEIVQRITRRPFADYLKDSVFAPLGLNDTSLGLGGRAIADVMHCQVDEVNAWDWNSPYWRNLAAPWGGAHSTAGDVIRFLGSFGPPGTGPLRPATAQAMISEQTHGLRPRWGLGWALNEGRFGRASSSAAFGHGGSTGTLCWRDPAKDLSFALLTTKPAEHSNPTVLYPAADRVSEAV